MPFLKVDAVAKSQGTNLVVDNITFTQDAFQKLALAGETGSGKTTLLKIIAGLVQPDKGIVYFEDIPVDGPDFQLVPGHPSIGFLSQHYELRNNYRVEELLSYANKLPEQEAQDLYDVCRISHLVTRRTDQLSGGEKQRIALARLLVGKPKLLLLDEPYSNLDPIHKSILKSVLKDISEKLSVTCLLTSHDPMDTLSWADEIMVIKDGKLLQRDQPELIYNRPLNAYVAGLFGTYYLLNANEAAAFGITRKDTTGSRQLFIRPGNLVISKAGDAGLKGEVERIDFWGTHYETMVRLNNRLFSVRSVEKLYEKGAGVNLALNMPAEPWYIDP